MGSWWRTVWVLWPALLDGVGRRSWMKVDGPVGAGVGVLVGMVNGIAGRRFVGLLVGILVGLQVG
jgi:hypothetical protein